VPGADLQALWDQDSFENARRAVAAFDETRLRAVLLPYGHRPEEADRPELERLAVQASPVTPDYWSRPGSTSTGWTFWGARECRTKYASRTAFANRPKAPIASWS
jgi:hypothetical protein